MRVVTLLEIKKRDWLNFSVGIRYLRKRGSNKIWAKYDHAGPIPRTATTVRRTRYFDGSASRQCHFHQPSTSEEPDGFSIGRPERLLCALGAVDFFRLQ